MSEGSVSLETTSIGRVEKHVYPMERPKCLALTWNAGQDVAQGTLGRHRCKRKSRMNTGVASGELEIVSISSRERSSRQLSRSTMLSK